MTSRYSCELKNDGSYAKKLKAKLRLWPLSGMLLLIVACSSELEVPKAAPALWDNSPTVAIPVALVITPELRAEQWKSTRGDQVTARVGEPLAIYAEKMLRSISSDVTVVRDAADAPAADFIVVPRPPRIEHASELWAHQQQTFTMALEWRVTGRDGRVLLQDTVVGEGRDNVGTSISHLRRLGDTFRLAMDDVFRKSRSRVAPVITRH